MTKRQFYLGTFILMTIMILGGTAGWFSLQNKRINMERTVQEKSIEADRMKYEQDKATERTRERWSFLPNFRSEKANSETTGNGDTPENQ